MKKTIILTLIALFCASFSLSAQNANAGKKDQSKKTEQKAEKKNNKAKVAEITFESLEHDYGNIYKGDNGECEFKFKNTGKAPLTITKCQASCGCTVPSWPRDPIAPGKTAVIKVKYDTNRLGTINKSITVTSDAINNNVVLHIKGHISERPAESVPAQDAPMMKSN
ncbi:MAG: DUF1573 domain-containing protein [Bacteroidales bacterium]|jgi:hypothetical protein|nr:DUF1573 domain-containing protein [Bacteroidales bacterium]